MKIEVYTNGSLEVNTYLLIQDGNVILVDPGNGVLPVLGEIKKRGMNVLAAFVTHPHIDHLDGIPLVKNIYPGAKCYISNEAVPILEHIHTQARLFGLKNPGKITFDYELGSEGSVKEGNFTIEFISTPGHCSGSLTYIIDGNIFPGDVLFKESVGRTDLPGGDVDLLRNSIEKKLFKYPDKTPVFPGHGDSTTIGYEKKNNPYING